MPTFADNATTYLHPLERNDGTFIERRASISSDISDQEHPLHSNHPHANHQQHRNHQPNWNQILSQFDSQPELMKLIHLCKQEEARRCQEETKMRLKEYQVLRQLQSTQQVPLLPPLSYKH